MKLYKKPKSKFYWFDFTVRGSLPGVNTGNEVSQGAKGGKFKTGFSD